MNYEKLKEFRFWNTLDAEITKSRYEGTRRDSLYPSEASAVSIDPETGRAKIYGGCLRSSWYRLMKVPKSDPPQAKSMWVFEFGRYIEVMITDICKKAGIYNNSSVKFWDKVSSVSGEIDIVLDLPSGDGIIHVECKSTYAGKSGSDYNGYNGLFDHYKGRGQYRKLIKGKPKEANLLQLAIYLYTHMDDENLIGGKLIYLLRDNFMRTEFDVIVKQEADGRHHIYVNGEREERFCVESIYERFATLRNKVVNDLKELQAGKPFSELIPIEKDFDLVYTDEKAKELFEEGELSKTKYEAHINREDYAGDWNCSYCDYKRYCQYDQLQMWESIKNRRAA